MYLMQHLNQGIFVRKVSIQKKTKKQLKVDRLSSKAKFIAGVGIHTIMC